MKKTIIWTGLTAASLFVHVAAFGGFGHVHHPRDDGFGGKPKRKPTLVEMSVAPAAPTAAPAAPLPPAVKPTHRVAVARPVRSKAAPAVAPSTAPADAPETPADFSGTTLTNDGPGAGWASATGNGQAMRGPVGTPGARVTGRSAGGDGTPVVGVGNLSRAPQAPDLAAMLERFYPNEARKKGLAGKAVMRARIMPDGQVREISLVSESGAGFGEACRQTLRGSRWTPPLDREGAAVSTYIHYACRFEVR